jgi:hypothetical protein
MKTFVNIPYIRRETIFNTSCIKYSTVQRKLYIFFERDSSEFRECSSEFRECSSEFRECSSEKRDAKPCEGRYRDLSLVTRNDSLE